MAKKNKKVKSALEPTVEAAVGDLAVEAVEESSDEPAKKKKKVKNIENGELNGVITNGDKENIEIDLEDTELTNTLSKKKKKKKVKVEETIVDEISAIDDDNSTELLSEISKKKLKKKEKKQKKRESLMGDSLTESEEVQSVQSPDRTQKESDKVTKGKQSIVRSSKLRQKDDLAYISNFMSYLHIPTHRNLDEEEDEDETLEMTEEARERLYLNRKPEDRATSKEELQERLKKKMEELRGSFGPNDKKKQKKLKRRMAALDKEKTNNELKQKLMEIGINAGKKPNNIAKDVEEMGGKMTKPGVKTDKGVVFSKFDFQEMDKEKKKNLDPETALRKIQKSKDKIKLWEEKGKTEKVKNIESSIAWTNAIGKAQGEKIKDDETLLKKSIKKKQQIKGSKKRKWEERVEGMEKRKATGQSKREENISKRKKDKKDKKMKHAVAKGRHVPGF